MKILTTPPSPSASPAAADLEHLQESLKALQTRISQWGQEWPALLEKRLADIKISTPLANESPEKWQEAFGQMEQRLKLCEQAAVEISQRMAGDMERLLKPSLDALEQKWTSVAQEWNSQLAVNHQTIQALQQAIQKLQETPPSAVEPPAVSDASVLPEFNHETPSFWSRLWGYLNEPAIDTSSKSKRS